MAGATAEVGRVLAGPATLLVIGIHREELAFGREVAERLAADAASAGRLAVLAIPHGIPGRRPRPDQRFRYDTLHRELYLQLLPHVVGRHRLLIDLHTGEDAAGPSADLFCADAALGRRLELAVARRGDLAHHDVRVVAIEHSTALHAHTCIPPQIWSNAAFRYLGIEIFLPADGPGRRAGRELAGRLVKIAAQCVDSPDR